MTDAIDLKPQEKKQVINLITQYLPNTTIWAFGSRVKFTSRPDSDLDLVAFTKPDQQVQVSKLKEAFEESDLPFRVDFLEWDTIPENFRKNIEEGEVSPLAAASSAPSSPAGASATPLGGLPEGWSSIRLGSITEWSSGGTPKVDKAEYWDGPIPWISASSMGGSRYSTSDRTLTELGLANGSRLANKHEVLLLVRGSMLHQRVPVGITMQPVAFNQDVKAIKTNEIINPWFLLYWLIGNEKKLLGMVSDTGIGAGKFDTLQLQDLIIPLPPLCTQSKIIGVIKVLDDKIALNRATSQTLEQIAQALFKSWFVDFDPVLAKAAGRQPVGMDEATAALFPDSFEESELGVIPMGWGVKRLGDVALYREGKIETKQLNLHTYVSTENMNANRGGITIATSLPNLLSVAYFQKGDTLISNIRPYFKKIWYATFDGGRSNDVLAFHSVISDTELYLNLLLNRDEFFNFMMTTSRGAKMPRGDKDAIENLQIVAPPAELMLVFSTQIKELMLMIESSNTQNESFTSIRDTLLPKLLSGEISVADAESQVALK